MSKRPGTAIRRLLGGTLAMLCTLGGPLAACGRAAMPSRAGKPVLAIVAGRWPDQSDWRLSEMLSNRIADLGRFRIVPEGQVRAALHGQTEGADTSPGLLGKLARSLGASLLILPAVQGALDWRQQREVATETRRRYWPHHELIVRTTHESVSFGANVRAAIRLYDARSGHEETLPFWVDAISMESNWQAESNALGVVARSLVLRLRELFPLRAAVAAKNGRDITLDIGWQQGVKASYYFRGVLDPAALVRVDRVFPDSCRGRLVQGYYHLGAGQRVVEDPRPVLRGDLGIGFASRATIAPGGLQSVLDAVEFHLNQSGADGPDLVFDLGYLTDSAGIGALSLGGHLDPQIEIIPEIFWLDAAIGAEADLYAMDQAGATLDADSYHALGSLGARLALPLGFKLSANAGWMTPFEVSTWSPALSGVPAQVPGKLPSFRIGGPFVQGSLSWSF